MKKHRKTEVLVGIFLLVGMLLLGGVILQFGSVREWFRETYTLKVSFPNASGIRQNAPVYLGGSRVGKVTKHPQLNDTFSGVTIEVEIYDDIDIPADAVFAIGTAGLMGDALIEIKPSGESTTAYIPHDYDRIIEGKVGGLSDLQATAEQVSKKVDVVLDDIRSAMTDVKEALVKVNKDALAPETIKNFKDSMEHLHKTMERVDTEVVDEENAATIKAALADFRDAAASVKKTAQNVETQSERLKGMFDKLEPALAKTDGVMTSIKSAADSFSGTARTIGKNEGLLGALLTDQELKTDFKDLISNMKRSGVVFYKNVADKERAKQEEAAGDPRTAPQPAPSSSRAAPMRSPLSPFRR
jgi:ABC-type transporter Mla subunit MlaD